MDTLKNKSMPFCVTLVGAIVALIGAILGWFTLENELLNTIANDELSEKQTVVIVIAVIVSAVTLIAGFTKKKMLAVLGVLIGAFAAYVTYNQLPTSAESELLEITTNIGFWLSLVGSIMMTIGSIGVLVKGTEKAGMAKAGPVETTKQS